MRFGVQNIFRLLANVEKRRYTLDSPSNLAITMDSDKSVSVLVNHEATKSNKGRECLWTKLCSETDLQSKLVAAPNSIALLSAINLFATEGEDFALVTNENDKRELKMLKFPDSFRTSVLQVSNSTYGAFRQADSSMQRIQLTMNSIPGDVLDILKLITRGTPDEIESGLKVHLSYIKKGADRSKDEAKKVLDEFKTVSLTLEDLHTAILIRKKGGEVAIKEAKEEIRKQKERQLEIEEKAHQYKEDLRIAKKEFEKRQRILDEELEYQGSIGKAVLDTFTGVCQSSLQAVTGAAKSLNPFSVFTQQNPMAVSAAQEITKTMGRPSDEITSEMYTRLELQRNLQEKAEDKLDKLKEKKLQNIIECREALNTIASFDATKASEEDVLKIIKQCLKSIADLIVQWEALVKFFDSINNYVEISLSERVMKFHDQVQEHHRSGLPMSPVIYENLVGPAQQSSSVAYCVEQIAILYGNISKDHFMPMVSNFYRFISLDATEDKHEIKKLKVSMDSAAKEVIVAIETKIMEVHDSTKLKLESQFVNFKEAVQKYIPPPRNLPQIQQAVHQNLQIIEECAPAEQDWSEFQ